LIDGRLSLAILCNINFSPLFLQTFSRISNKGDVRCTVAILCRSRRSVRKTLKEVGGGILKKPRRSLSEEYVDQRVSVVALKFAGLAGKKFRLQRTKRQSLNVFRLI
jgi:hypothetical protein